MRSQGASWAGPCLKDYSKKHVAQQPFKDKSARSGGNERANTIKFNDVTQQVNTMKSHNEPIPKQKKGEKQKKKPKSDQANADTSEDGHMYGIDRLNMGKPENESENESE